MKSFKSINISSDGSLYVSFQNSVEQNFEQIIFKKKDDKNFNLNQKINKYNMDSKQSIFYKKKIFKLIFGI